MFGRTTGQAILMVSADTTVTANMVISDYLRVLPWHTFQLPYEPENLLIMTFCMFVCLIGRTKGQAILMVSADMTVTTDMVISDYVRVLPWHTFKLQYNSENIF